tara:strand:+ start:6728 stop:9118 length:2391 start_codon:yes stop_codon:yes gene_type:complete
MDTSQAQPASIGPTHTNALAGETSPYLLQHAHNPVDWFPWGDEAFAEARRRDVPVFLSIGYSTCYWCHVMERESFEHETVAKVMNERFVCIKVDREERPDIDEIYMAATTIFSGSGGWPMSVFLEPESRKPFYAGTYFPPEPAHGRPSFTQLLEGLSQAWKEQNQQVIEQAESIATAVIEQVASSDSEPIALGEGQLSAATSALLQRFDPTNGGFSGAPKFPQPVFLEYLLAFRAHTDEGTRIAIDKAVKKTLDAMAMGGLNDQIGGGFHRYSVDSFWTVPHFEKMLYDNAQLAGVYTRAAAVYGDAYYERIARKTLDYALSEMTEQSQPGSAGFYSAQDAEVDGREGLNYLWTPEQINEVLGEGTPEAKLALDLYGLDSGPNFQDPHHPNEPKRSVLRLEARLDELADRSPMSDAEFVASVDGINAKLMEARTKRKQPGLDDKVIVSWNGLLIAALVEAGEAFNEPRYVQAAERAAGFILSNMKPDQLVRAYRANIAKVPGLLEDYAMLLSGLIKLHRSSMVDGVPSIETIIELADEAHGLFAGVGGAYFDTRAQQADLFVRTKSVHDGAIPSASGVMLHNLIDIAELVAGDEAQATKFRTRAAGLLESISGALAGFPMSAINSARALIKMLEQEPVYAPIYLFGDPTAKQTKPKSKAESPVQVLVSTASIEVGDDQPSSFKIALEIKDGYHIVAADPGESQAAKGLHPLRVGLTRGQGVAVYADYPQGESYGLESVGEFNINTGRIEFEVAIEKAPGVGPTPGTPMLGISFQACTDSACQAPAAVELDIEIVIN